MSKKKHKKHKHSRDTQFARFAAQFWRDLESAFAVEGIKLHRYRGKKLDEIAQGVLAKLLYDFADHVTSNMVFTFAKDIPDLRENEHE